MTISNLAEGLIIKNYKELCNILEIKVSSGNTKIKQMEELKLYCNYEKQGNKYIIKEIYKAPTITINDLLKTKNSKYIKLLANIMLEQLYKNPDELQQIPLIKLFTMLGVTNDNYKSANTYRKELSQLYNVQLASIYYFYSNTRNEFKRIIERCLNNLQKRSVLFWNKCIMIVKIIDKDHKQIYKADEGTKKMILDTQKEALQYMNLSNMTELMKDRKRLKEFNDIIKKELNFSYYFAYDITIGDKAIKIEYDNIQKERKDFNKLIINKSNKLFNNEFFSRFQNDYETLINVLIDTDYKSNIQQLLIDKKEENLNNYINDNIKVTKEYNSELLHIKDKYIDTFSYDDI